MGMGWRSCAGREGPEDAGEVRAARRADVRRGACEGDREGGAHEVGGVRGDERLEGGEVGVVFEGGGEADRSERRLPSLPQTPTLPSVTFPTFPSFIWV